MKFLFTALSIIIFTTNTYAVSGEGLQEALNELQYSLTVEWDQKDKSFYDQQMTKFNSKIKELQGQGLSNADMMSFIITNTKSEALRKELSNLMLLVKINKLSQEEALTLVKEKMNETQAKGASWNGSTYDRVAMVLVAALVTVFVVAYAQCLSDPNHITVCSDDYVCTYDSYYGDRCSYQTSCGCSH